MIKLCVFCKGKLEPEKTSYVENNGDHVILIKDVPCEKCAQCGETYFDNITVQEIERILSQNQHISSDIMLTVVDYHMRVA